MVQKDGVQNGCFGRPCRFVFLLGRLGNPQVSSRLKCQGCIKLNIAHHFFTKKRLKSGLINRYEKIHKDVKRSLFHIVSEAPSHYFILFQMTESCVSLSSTRFISNRKKLRGNGVRYQKRQQRTEPKHTVDGWNPARKPVEVGSWSPIICRLYLDPTWLGRGFLNHQQWHLLEDLENCMSWPDGQAGHGRILEIETEKNSGWRFQIFLFSPRTPGKWNPIWLSHIFHMGWFNHQLDLALVSAEDRLKNAVSCEITAWKSNNAREPSCCTLLLFEIEQRGNHLVEIIPS